MAQISLQNCLKPFKNWLINTEKREQFGKASVERQRTFHYKVISRNFSSCIRNTKMNTETIKDKLNRSFIQLLTLFLVDEDSRIRISRLFVIIVGFIRVRFTLPNPFCGMLVSPDYIRMLKNLKYYFERKYPLKFVQESKISKTLIMPILQH